MPSEGRGSAASSRKDGNQSPESESKDNSGDKRDKLEVRMNIVDFRKIMEMFSEGDDFLNFTREQFIEAMITVGATGTREEFGKMFERIDVTKEGVVNWDKFASHMLLEFYEKDDKTKSNQVPHWNELKVLVTSVHKDVVQRIHFLKSNNRYVAISKEGSITMWTPELRLNRSLRTSTESCRTKDLWVTDVVPLPPPINKIALSFTSKEIAVYDMSSKIDFNTQYKITELPSTPLCMDFWVNPANPNIAKLVWGDVSGCVNAINFSSAVIALFERPAAPAGGKQDFQDDNESAMLHYDPCLTVKLADIQKGLYKNAKFVKHSGHSEWVRKVKYCHGLECFLSCATTYNDAVVIGWLEQNVTTMKTYGEAPTYKVVKKSKFQILQGINDFDYHPTLNLIATGGVNHQVCLWNPYVISKPNGLLRGHMAAVIQVQFIVSRNQLLSFSKDKVLRIWDVGLQVCIQRLAGMFPKGGEVQSVMLFDELRNRLFLTFNYQITTMSMKNDTRDRVLSHEKPVTTALYNETYNQVVSVDQGGTLVFWQPDNGQRIKANSNVHGDAEVTTLAQDSTGTNLYTGSTDGTIKVWDFNGHCYHTLHASDKPSDISLILPIKTAVLAVGWTRFITIFRSAAFKDFHVHPADWKGGQEHRDDILAAACSSHGTLASASYDGEIVLWSTATEQVIRKLTARAKPGKRGSIMPPISRQSTALSAGNQSHTSRSRSSRFSRNGSTTSSSKDATDAGYTITTLIFLESRCNSEHGANLISCGGNGWLRFWNSHTGTVIAEFVAHPRVGSIIMATDKENKFLVTADVDGMLKSWLLEDYSLQASEDGSPNLTPPALIAHWTPHIDSVTSLSVFERQEKYFVLSASSDCCVVLSDIKGKVLGTFGQDNHWTIEPFVAGVDDDFTNLQVEDDGGDEESRNKSFLQDDNWKPDERATEDPKNFKVDSWSSSLLGHYYQETRKQKRERRQPTTIPDLPYLFWEKTGSAPAGPFNALETRDLDDVDTLKKPDFMSNPHKFFGEKIEDVLPAASTKLPALSESLSAAFDEKSLFPKYILDYEYEAKKLSNQQHNQFSKRTSLAPTRQASGSKRTQSKQALKK